VVHKLYFSIPIFNEEDNLEQCITSLYDEAKSLNQDVETFLCLNGCTDNSKKIALILQKKYPRLNIKILHSKKGKLKAQDEIIKNIRSKTGYIIFLDSDIEVKNGCIKKLISELDKHKEIIIVGALPIAKVYAGSNLWKKLLSQVLNIRSKHPLLEKSSYDVREYHPYAFSDPQQVNITPDQELQSKIFFHGRMFVMRSKEVWAKPSKCSGVVGDDTFLSDNTLYRYGKGSIRTRYDAIVYYEPFTSLLAHYNVYKRIYYDLKNLERSYPNFKDIRKLSKLKTNKDYLCKQNKKTRILFYTYDMIRKIERFLFRVSIEKNPSKIWDCKAG